MARTSKRAARKAPELRVSPKEYLVPHRIQALGSGWGACPVRFFLNGEEPIRPTHVLGGEDRGETVMPTRGEFCVLFSLPELPAGKYFIVAREDRADEAREAHSEFERPAWRRKGGRLTNRWLLRQAHFFRRRFGDRREPHISPRAMALEHRDRMRSLELAKVRELDARRWLLDREFPRIPIFPGSNWYCIGPSVVRRGQVFSTTANAFDTAPISGRITAIAYDPNDTSVVYAAAAQGGVWKSTDAGANWTAKSDHEVSLAMGAVTVDPSVTDASGRSTRIWAGTGEPNGAIGTYYGAGLLLSTDGGDTWVQRGGAVFARAAISTIAVDPADNQHLFVASDIGVWESDDEGLNWNRIEFGVCHDLVVDWANAGGAELYVGRSGVGVRRSQDGGANWATSLTGANRRVALAMAPSNANVVYAAFDDGTNAGGVAGIFQTTDGGTNWTAVTTPAGTGQAFYNLVLGVSPTNSNTLLFGEVHLWRSTNGGTNWTRVTTGSPGIHADQHAIAYHPTNANQVYVGNDGGVWFSNDGGVTYTHRNKDLATLMYFTVSHHPQWDAVLLGGTQDNGTQRYLGHPAWEHSALGDGAYTAIDSTANTFRWFESRFSTFPIFRSDTAGAPGSWVDKKAGITTNNNWFYPPFAIDPSDSAVLYVGFDELWRTSTSGDGWTDITGSLVAAGVSVTAIAVAPSDSNTVWVGMSDGKVFKVTQSAGVWTATDVTGAPLPAGAISDIAVHPTDANIVYVTTSDLLFTESAREFFTNDHVFRTTDGGVSWAARATGLAQANPVNAIALDPANPNTVWIGCDVGVFRSTDGGGSWTTYDQGLPNCAVHDLQFFAPKRLLRAATHGRSIWELQVDALSVPPTDIYMRDDVVDRGLTQPTPSGVEHPFVAGDTIYWYQSPDIKVDSPDPASNAYASSGTSIDYLEFEELSHDNPRRDTSVRVFAQVHNRGNEPATNVKVRAFWANAGGGLPNLPADFWTAFPNADPADTSVWRPVGPARTIASIDPEQPQIAFWSWPVPADAPDHTCMLCAVKSDEDAVTTTSLAISTAVKMDNNVTLKNLHVDDVVPGATGADESATAYFIDFATLNRKVRFDVLFNPGTLPRGTNVRFYFPNFEASQPSRETFHGLKLGKPERPVRLPPRADQLCGRKTEYDTEREATMRVTGRPRKRPIGVYGIIPTDETFSLAFRVELPKEAVVGERYSFHIEHRIAGELVGGSSYEFRASKPPRKPRRSPRRKKKRAGKK